MEGLNQGEALPYSKKTKKRPSVTKRAKIIAAGSAAVAAVLAFGGLYLQQQETIESNAAQASQFTPSSQAAPRPKPPVVAFVGDSYTQGAGASSESKRWPFQLARQEGWVEANFGRGGTGYLTSGGTGCGLPECLNYSEMIPEVAARGAEIVVVSGGRNDVGTDPDVSREAITSFYDQLRAKLPNARIIAVSPVWDDDKAPAGVAQLSEAVQLAASTVGAEYVDIGQPLQDPAFISEDGVHPNDRGHAALAAAVATALKQ